MTKTQAKREASRISVQEERLCRGNTVYLCRLTNGVVGFGKSRKAAHDEAVRRAAFDMMTAVNTGRIAVLSPTQMKRLDKALR